MHDSYVSHSLLCNICSLNSVVFISKNSTTDSWLGQNQMYERYIEVFAVHLMYLNVCELPLSDEED